MTSYRYKVPRLEQVTKAIGYVCVYWAWLEDSIGEMILDLAPFDKTKITPKEEKQLRDVIFIDSDIRSKIKILRAVAFIRKINGAWFKKFDKILDTIDNDLRPRRNRIVHGRWHSPKRGLERRGKLARLKRPQSFAELELTTEETTPVKMREIWQLSKAIIRAEADTALLMIAQSEFQKAVDEGIREQLAKDEAHQTIQMFADDAAEGGPLLNALLTIFLARHPHQQLGGNRPTTPPARQRPRRRSSREKPPG
jgi:hypothetical protein